MESTAILLTADVQEGFSVVYLWSVLNTLLFFLGCASPILSIQGSK